MPKQRSKVPAGFKPALEPEQPDRKEQEISAAEFWRGHRRAILTGLLVLVLLAAGGAMLLRSFLLEGPTAARQEAASVGLIDIRKVLPAHPDYGRLQSLKEEALTLELSLKARADAPTLKVEPPKVEEQPFEDSVWQKNAQTVIGARVQLSREARAEQDKYREETRAAYEAQRDALDAEYLNAILNLNLKLDNQQQMHHPWEKEEELAAERAGWEAELAALKQERGERQQALREAWEAQIAAHVQQVMAPRIAAWDAQSKQALARQQSEAIAGQAQAQARNAALMEQQMKLSAQIQQHLQERELLAAHRQAIAALENHIYHDIAGKAAKIAILHHFELILATPLQTLAAIFPGKDSLTWEMPAYGDVLGLGTEDVTEELVAEIKTIQPSANAEGQQ